MSDEQGSWWGCCLKGCLVTVIVGLLLGYYAYIKTMEAARNLAAYSIEKVVQKSMEGMSFTEADTEKFLKPVKNFTQKIREAKISLKNAKSVATALMESSVIPMMVAYGFENHHVKASQLSDEEKKTAHVNITRFMNGVLSGKIEKKKINELSDLMSETREQNGKQQKRLKDKLSKEELGKCLDFVKMEADSAKIVEGATEVDLALEIEKVINQGLAKKIN